MNQSGGALKGAAVSHLEHMMSDEGGGAAGSCVRVVLSQLR